MNIKRESKTWMDVDTGEIIPVEQVTKYCDKEFWKVYLFDFLNALGIIESKQLDVLIYILQNVKPSDNLFIGTYSKIEKKTGVTRKTIAKIMVKLQERGYIKKVQNGVWMISPDIMMKGKPGRRKNLMIEYHCEEDSEE